MLKGARGGWRNVRTYSKQWRSFLWRGQLVSVVYIWFGVYFRPALRVSRGPFEARVKASSGGSAFFTSRPDPSFSLANRQFVARRPQSARKSETFTFMCVAAALFGFISETSCESRFTTERRFISNNSSIHVTNL